MGILGRITGWDQQKEAHNAVLASHLADTAGPELKALIAGRLVMIMQQVVHRGTGDPEQILRQLSARARIVQVNFVALACNSLGVPPALRGLAFAEVSNPYRADNDSSLDRIGVALKDLSRRSGQSLNWPGNDAKLDFVAWADVFATHGVAGGREETRTSRKIAVDLAFRVLLGEAIDEHIVQTVAANLAEAVGSPSDHDLAMATALLLFEQDSLVPHLQVTQLMARMTVAEWMLADLVSPEDAQMFEERLYVRYKI